MENGFREYGATEANRIEFVTHWAQHQISAKERRQKYLAKNNNNIKKSIECKEREEYRKACNEGESKF